MWVKVAVWPLAAEVKAVAIAVKPRNARMSLLLQ
jgi:hypothetical protein